MTARPSRAIPHTLLALSVIGGIALWLTPAAFDLVIAPSGDPMRVAMLPPVWQLPVFVFAAALGIAAIAALLPAASAEDDARAPSLSSADVLMPVAALGVLALPYLPWLPDALPILRVLAGPGRALVWFTVAALVARGFWRAVPRRVRLVDAPPGRVALALFIAGTLIGGGTAMVFTRTILYPGGDEPHYLIIAQSLWRDGDLTIENNHRRGDYREYFENELAPHYLTRGLNRRIYSVHPIGLPVLLAPVYALGGYALVVWVMAAMASGAGALAWLAALRATGSRVAATVAWLACCANGPWLFNSFAVYPEVPAALMVMAAWLCIQPNHRVPAGAAIAAESWERWLACGAAIGTLPWLSTKYAPMAFVLALVGLARIWLPDTEGGGARAVAPGGRASPSNASERDASVNNASERDADDGSTNPGSGVAGGAAGSDATRRGAAHLARWPSTASMIGSSSALIVPFAISLVGWFAFFYTLWGTISPAAPYGAQRETRLEYLPEGGPGLLFDQEYGLLAFAPALLLALTGLAAMLASRGRQRRLAIEILLIGGALLGTVGAFHIWWGGSAAVGRPIIAGLLLLAVPFAWRYEQQRAKPALRAAYHVLIVIGVGIALTLALAQGGMLLAAHRSGVSRVLDWLSPTWTLWTIAPTFIAQPPIAALGTTFIWIAVALGAGWWLGRQPRTLTPGRATLTALLACAVSLLLVSVIVPLSGWRAADPRGAVAKPVENGTPSPDGRDAKRGGGNSGSGEVTSRDLLVSRLRARGRSELLDRFDATRRPIAIAYDPWMRIDPASAPSLVELIARPTDRRPRPPIPLLYNARWSLPAGRYTIELIAGAGANAAGRGDAGRGSRGGGEASAAPDSGSIGGTLSLLVGYSGRPTREWDVSMGAPGVWGRAFDLPTDVNLVGFRASSQIERAAPTLRVIPQAVVDVSTRLQPADVTSSALFGAVTLYFHDARVHAEDQGFWTPGASTVMVTMAAQPAKPTVVALRAGPVRTAVELSVHDWRERVLLEPNGERSVTLPATSAGILRLFVETGTGFIPASLDPASRDRRTLGVWVSIPAQ